MSFFVMIRHKVTYTPHWKAIFDQYQNDRQAHGLRTLHVLKGLDNKNDTTVVLAADDLKKAKEFLTSKFVEAAMGEAGVVPNIEVKYLSGAT